MQVKTKQYLGEVETISVQALIGTFDERWLGMELDLLEIPDELLVEDGIVHHAYRNFKPHRTVRSIHWKIQSVLVPGRINFLEPEFPVESRFEDFSRTVIRALHLLRRQERNMGPKIFNDDGNANIFRSKGCEAYINFFYDSGKWVVDASAESVKDCFVGDRFFFPA